LSLNETIKYYALTDLANIYLYLFIYLFQSNKKNVISS